MEGKKLKYGLFAAVIIIWAIIIYRIICGISSESINPVFASPHQPPNYKNTNDTFVLFEGYTDPFLQEPDTLQLELDSLNGELKNTLPAQPLPTSINQSPTEIIDISFIHYLGMLSNTDNRDKIVGFVKFNEKEEIVKTGQLINDVLIRKILPDKLLIRYKKKVFIIQKESF